MDKIFSDTKLILATPRGFCAGVERAVDIVNKAIDIFGSPIYVKHEVVHNKYVIEDLEKRGVLFIEDIEIVPENSILIYSAHGVSIKVKKDAEKRNLKIFDATCPLVTKVHLEVHRYSQTDTDVVLIGHKGHPEIEGTIGQYKSPNGKIHLVENLDDIDKLLIGNKSLAYVTQTTLSIDDTKNIITKLIKKYPHVQSPAKSDICYATQNRQDAVKSILKYCDYLLVIGSINSSNSRRLVELALKNNIPSKLIDNKHDISLEELQYKKNIGITAGASAPQILLDEVTDYLVKNGATLDDIKQDVIIEDITFSIPKELRDL
ncbi:MAG: 4-hydroxy-3-methylbut-2-enyl diphosphate reductase [Gammaproteobacteria bacterium]|jgi:4-hydroxy-3-methylbut-2-enyl diphosphate reductase|tara:strand:+ start:5694 stop:6650 length:957 start_codon:yes stop_codon:yes gene_type:complete